MTTQPYAPNHNRHLTIEISGVTGTGKTCLLHILGRFLHEQGFPVALEDKGGWCPSDSPTPAIALDDADAVARDLDRIVSRGWQYPVLLRTRLTELPGPADNDPADD